MYLRPPRATSPPPIRARTRVATRTGGHARLDLRCHCRRARARDTFEPAMDPHLRAAVIALVGLGLAAPVRAAPASSCVLTPEVREAVRDHNTKAKQEFEESRFLLAALQWLLAQDIVPADDACASQRTTRVDLAARALRNYLDGLRYLPDDANDLGESQRLLARHLESLPEGPRRTELGELAVELACVRDALADTRATLECTAAGRATIPPPAEPTPPPVVVEAPPPAPVPPPPDPRIERRRRSYAAGFGVSLGLAVGALAAGVGAWAIARTGGPQHRRIRDAAAASLDDADPSDDVPPNLPPDRDYCDVARAVDNASIVALCTRHDRTAAASIAGFALAGAFTVASATFAALWATARRPAGKTARRWRLDLGWTRGGATVSGALRF